MNASPKAHPTEWSVFFIAGVNAVVQFIQNHDRAALISAVAAILPGLFTALVEMWRKRVKA